MKPLIPFFHRLTKKANKKLELDLRQVAVSTKSRLDAVEGFSGKIVGFVLDRGADLGRLTRVASAPEDSASAPNVSPVSP